MTKTGKNDLFEYGKTGREILDGLQADGVDLDVYDYNYRWFSSGRDAAIGWLMRLSDEYLDEDLTKDEDVIEVCGRFDGEKYVSSWSATQDSGTNTTFSGVLDVELWFEDDWADDYEESCLENEDEDEDDLDLEDAECLLACAPFFNSRRVQLFEKDGRFYAVREFCGGGRGNDAVEITKQAVDRAIEDFRLVDHNDARRTVALEDRFFPDEDRFFPD